MRYCRHERIVTDSHGLPDGEIFTVYRSGDGKWAFAMRIKGKFTLTPFYDENVDESTVKYAYKKIKFCQIYGWSYTGQKSWNTEIDDHENLFMCMYCPNTTFDITDPCPCRNKKKEDLYKTTESGIILPL